MNLMEFNLNYTLKLKLIYFMFNEFNIIDRISENCSKLFIGAGAFPHYTMYGKHCKWDVWECLCICPLLNIEEDIYINTPIIYQVHRNGWARQGTLIKWFTWTETWNRDKMLWTLFTHILTFLLCSFATSHLIISCVYKHEYENIF